MRYIMTKRTDVLKSIKQGAKFRDIRFRLLRYGSKHDVWDLGGQRITVPRHTEIEEKLAKAIFAQCEETLGKDWWRR